MKTSATHTYRTMLFFLTYNSYLALKDLLLLVINVIITINNFRPCIKKDTRERFALKCLMDGPKAHTEVKLHRLCSDHSNIVRVLDVYANDVLFPGDPHPK